MYHGLARCFLMPPRFLDAAAAERRYVGQARVGPRPWPDPGQPLDSSLVDPTSDRATPKACRRIRKSRSSSLTGMVRAATAAPLSVTLLGSISTAPRARSVCPVLI